MAILLYVVSISTLAFLTYRSLERAGDLDRLRRWLRRLEQTVADRLRNFEERLRRTWGDDE